MINPYLPDVNFDQNFQFKNEVFQSIFNEIPLIQDCCLLLELRLSIPDLIAGSAGVAPQRFRSNLQYISSPKNY